MRQREYFLGYWQEQIKTGQAQLFFAKYEGVVVAAAFVTYLGHNSWYKDGGSSREQSKLMAPYLLQWEIMRWLKAKGVTKYDLVGIPPLDQLNESHAFYGLYHFKSGFAGTEMQFIGTYDLPLSAWKYQIWRHLGERLTLAYYAKFKKELWY
jgi:lipid II:glycine glycyltransferase (peptidoglycan interpeptide bridge formation enzyme)